MLKPEPIYYTGIRGPYKGLFGGIHGVGTIEQDIAKKTGRFSTAQRSSCRQHTTKRRRGFIVKLLLCKNNAPRRSTMHPMQAKQLGKPVTDVSGLLFSASTIRTYLLFLRRQAGPT